MLAVKIVMIHMRPYLAKLRWQGGKGWILMMEAKKDTITPLSSSLSLGMRLGYW